jgi:hypothetical protein
LKRELENAGPQITVDTQKRAAEKRQVLGRKLTDYSLAMRIQNAQGNPGNRSYQWALEEIVCNPDLVLLIERPEYTDYANNCIDATPSLFSGYTTPDLCNACQGLLPTRDNYKQIKKEQEARKFAIIDTGNLKKLIARYNLEQLVVAKEGPHLLGKYFDDFDWKQSTKQSSGVGKKDSVDWINHTNADCAVSNLASTARKDVVDASCGAGGGGGGLGCVVGRLRGNQIVKSALNNTPDRAFKQEYLAVSIGITVIIVAIVYAYYTTGDA